ncbi:MAG TPA: hypothetical protein VFD43_05625, partial [Planctomycetota bacterium]|nr:hypothetical protein [Planctomycetota bacterium]
MTAAPAPQQALPLRVDCGDLNGYATPEAGWSPFGESQALAGVSLSPAALDTVHVAGLGTDGSTPVPSDCWAVDADELPQRHRLTSLKLADPSTLTVSGLPASATFRVRVELGALAPWADVVGTSYTLGAFTTSSAVKVEELVTPGTWRSVAQGVRCTTGYFSNSFQSVLGGIVPVWVLAHSNASGTLTLRFSSTATTGADPIFLAGFEVHAHEPLPVVYHAAGGQGPLVSGAPALAAYVA